MQRDTGNWSLYQYRVEFSVEVESKRRRIGIVKNHLDKFSDYFAFDGGNDLFAREQLPDTVKKFMQIFKIIDKIFK